MAAGPESGASDPVIRVGPADRARRPERVDSLPYLHPALARCGGECCRRSGTWSLIALIAALAWVLTVGEALDMGIEPGKMGRALPLFLALWLTMMAAMMLPSVPPSR
ncbi:putative membrane protein [Streptomyces davaonensis JCM 4913]|uniref:Putative membrane protein n=1 Tax=Streptomyces davaonensis (strain DSM 101723 / JCM 4913 / KCC S-0913 / 768) TaxID=1214101 RepID=K4R6F7_STRDJ|nr:putative membrane protein [Streptomyces davaonensis JCM 4913]